MLKSQKWAVKQGATTAQNNGREGREGGRETEQEEEEGEEGDGGGGGEDGHKCRQTLERRKSRVVVCTP